MFRNIISCADETRRKRCGDGHLFKDEYLMFFSLLHSSLLYKILTQIFTLSIMQTDILASSHSSGNLVLLSYFMLPYLMSCSFFSSTKVGGTVDTTTCMSNALTTET